VHIPSVTMVQLEHFRQTPARARVTPSG